MTARRRRRTAGMGRGLVRNWRRGASVRCAEARQQAGRLRGKCFFPPHSVSSIFVHELYLLLCQRPHAQLFANIIQYTSFRWALFAPFFHVRACVRATCACCARAATSEREHTTASHAQCARAMDSHSCVHATCACHACARACMCAGVVHRRVFAHATQKTTKKKVPLLQTKERFKSKRARARWRAVGRAAIGNRYKLSDSGGGAGPLACH